MPGLTRPLLAFALLLPACGPDKDDTTDSSPATTTAGPTTADTTDTTVDPSGTTADNPTTTTAETGNTTDAFVPCPDDALPPDGSPCATNGDSCDPFGDPCAPYTYAECLDGTWHHVDVGPGDPNECGDPCDPFPEEGQPCTADGTYCNTGCEDQCQFCNILMCSAGTWNHLEAPPAPCLDCPEICPFTVMPMCANGPPDEAACVTGCQDVMAGPCSVEFSATRACAGFEPTFSCDDAERPTVAGCEMQFADLYACLGI